MGRLARRRERKAAERRAQQIADLSGQPYEGDVVRVNDPALVKWPGLYAVDANGQTVYDVEIKGNRAEGWRYA